MTETVEQVSSFTVNGRTLGLNKDFDRSILGDYEPTVKVTVVQSGKVFIECESIADAAVLFETFKENELRPRVISYSLFFRSKDELTVDEATSIFSSMTDANIMYIRVDKNNHTGKLVVDTLSDYQAFKSFEDETLQFYHFDFKSKKTRYEARRNREN